MVVVVVGLANLFENFLFIRIEHVRQRMRDHAGDVGFHRVLCGRSVGNRAGHPEHQINICQYTASTFRSRGDLFFGVRDVLVSDTDQNNDPVGDASGKLEHSRPAGGDINRHIVFTRMKQVNFSARQLRLFAGEELAHLLQ